VRVGCDLERVEVGAGGVPLVETRHGLPLRRRVR
jgi:hypothetical protein